MASKISIVGAGIAGLSTAVAIRKSNPDLELEIFESASEIKPVGAGLTLAANAITAFDHIGLKDKILAISAIINTFKIVNEKGKQITQTNHLAINRNLNTISSFSVHRADLHQVLLSELVDIPIYRNKRVVGFCAQADGMNIEFMDGTVTYTDFIIAADGIHSKFKEILLPQSKVRFAGYTCWRGVCDLNQVDKSKIESLESHCAIESWGQGKRFGIVPLTQNRVYWFACINSSEVKNERFAAYGKKELMEAFAQFHAPVCQLIDITPPEKLLWNDILDFAPIGQYAFNKIVLIGDAAHATTPNLGQGACQAIEDAAVLSNLVSKNFGIQAAFQLFEQKRIKRARSIVNRSWQLGKLAQLDNALLSRLRDFIFRHIPEKVNQQQIKSLLDFQL